MYKFNSEINEKKPISLNQKHPRMHLMKLVKIQMWRAETQTSVTAIIL